MPRSQFMSSKRPWRQGCVVNGVSPRPGDDFHHIEKHSLPSQRRGVGGKPGGKDAPGEEREKEKGKRKERQKEKERREKGTRQRKEKKKGKGKERQPRGPGGPGGKPKANQSGKPNGKEKRPKGKPKTPRRRHWAESDSMRL